MHQHGKVLIKKTVPTFKMSLEKIIEYSVGKIVSHEVRKQKSSRISSSIGQMLKGNTDMNYESFWNRDEFMYNIKRSVVSKAITSDIVDRKYQRRNAFAESCDTERKLLMRIVFDLIRDSHIQNFINS